MSRFYQVLGIDEHGCNLRTIETDTLSEAKIDAKLLRTEHEYIDAGMVRVQVVKFTDDDYEIISDVRVQS